MAASITGFRYSATNAVLDVSRSFTRNLKQVVIFGVQQTLNALLQGRRTL